MSQQTSVDWLINELIFKSEYEHLPNNYFLMSDKDIDKIIKQAKEMEKKQHSRTWDAALDACEKRGQEDFDEYYNEKFNNQ